MNALAFLRRHGVNLLLFGLVGYLLIERIPALVDMSSREGVALPAAEVETLGAGRVNIPQPKKQVLVFWATWCGPCKVELARLNRLVRSGTLKADSVLAVSIGEARRTVEDHARENDYLFLVGFNESSSLGRLYKIAGTPTIMLVREDGELEWMTVGISPTLELRLKRFFDRET